MRDIWNPWHGCTKYSEGCQNCYMYALDKMRGVELSPGELRRTKSFDYPLKKDRKGNYKLRPGERIRVNMTSDSFIEGASEWIQEIWEIVKKRPDLVFWFLTKRVPNIERMLPPDWGGGYPNVMLNMTAENQRTFDERWPIFERIPAKAKGICCAPLLSGIDLGPALASGKICEVSAGGENYDDPRPCHYEWVEGISRQCRKYDVTFHWYESGTWLIKDRNRHYIPRKPDQAKVAGMAGLNHFAGKPVFELHDPEDGHLLTDAELHVPMFNPIHCLGCGNAQMCNGCDPACKMRDKAFRQVTYDELKMLEKAKKGL